MAFLAGGLLLAIFGTCAAVVGGIMGGVASGILHMYGDGRQWAGHAAVLPSSLHLACCWAAGATALTAGLTLWGSALAAAMVLGLVVD